MIRVAIADDHPELRLALRLLLRMNKEIEVVCEAGNGQEAVDCVKRLQPDVLVTDIHMPVMDGIEATEQIINLSLPTKIIMISTDRGIFVARGVAAIGARGFVPKDDLPKLLIKAIKTVHAGGVFFVE
jgi:DNA-binding NarL/FixJ family response regulator